MPDELIQELWTIRDQSARDVAFNLDGRCRRLQERDRRTAAPVVDLSQQRRGADDLEHQRRGNQDQLQPTAPSPEARIAQGTGLPPLP